jgi:hypothetical protein
LLPAFGHLVAPSRPPTDASGARRIPSFLLNAVLRMVRSSVLKRAGFDMFNVRPIADVGQAFVPAVSTRGL